MNINDFNPNKNPKYSKAIFNILERHFELNGRKFPRIIKFCNDIGWYIGWLDNSWGDGTWFTGRRLAEHGASETFSYKINKSRIKEEIKWEDYERIGRCAYDERSHEYVYVNKKSRKCVHCGQWQRREIRTVKTVERETHWVNIVKDRKNG